MVFISMLAVCSLDGRKAQKQLMLSSLSGFFFSQKIYPFEKKGKSFSIIKASMPTNFVHLELKLTLKMREKVETLGLRKSLNIVRRSISNL